MYNYAKCRAPGPRARGANLKRKREGISSLSTGLFILECDCNLLEDYEADFLAIDVARSEGAIFDVSNSHFLFLSFVLSVFIIPYFWLFVNRFFNNFLIFLIPLDYLPLRFPNKQDKIDSIDFH